MYSKIGLNWKKTVCAVARVAFCLLALILFSGCATNWPKQMDKKLALMNEKGLVLSTITFHNKLDPTDSLVPHKFVLGKGGRGDKIYLGGHPGGLRALSEDKSTYLVVLTPDDAACFVHSIRGQIIGDFWRPFFEAPILMNFEAKKNQIIYIGNIHMTLRDKVSDAELRAGPVLPALDQASIAGATFDVEIRDNFLPDVAEFRKIFPKLNSYEISKAMLPAWKRPTETTFDPKDTHFGF